MLLAGIFLLSSLAGCWCADNFTCYKSFCPTFTQDKPCGKLPSGCSKGDEGHEASGYYFPSPSACNCCEYCVTWSAEGAYCVVDVGGTSTPTSMCGPLLSCSKGTRTCQTMDTACTREQRRYDDDFNSGSLGVARWRPTCGGTGDYSFVKCIPNSICYCVDPQDGSRIFGEKVYRDAYTPLAMYCGCSLSAWRASQLGYEVESAHCMADGSFDSLQCVAGNCTCVNPTDGGLMSSETVSVSELRKGALPCFDPSLHTNGKFLRPCEEKRKQFQSLMMDTDYIFINVHLPKCSPDGRYAPAQVVAGVGRCVDPEGNTIENFQWSGEDGDCECARVRWLLRDYGAAELPACSSDGSYRPWQCWRGSCYCVDCLGNQISSDKSRAALEELPCHNATRCQPQYGEQ